MSSVAPTIGFLVEPLYPFGQSTQFWMSMQEWKGMEDDRRKKSLHDQKTEKERWNEKTACEDMQLRFAHGRGFCYCSRHVGHS